MNDEIADLPIENRIRQLLLTYPLRSEERNYLKWLLGELAHKRTNQHDSEAILRTILKSNREISLRARNPKERIRLEIEIRLLEQSLGEWEELAA